MGVNISTDRVPWNASDSFTPSLTEQNARKWHALRCKAFNFFLKILTTPHGMQDLSSLPGIRPSPSAVEVQSLNHWTAGEVRFKTSF